MCLLRCTASIVQWALFILNFLLSIIGLTLVGLGIYALIQVNNVDDGSLSNLAMAPVIVIVIGCIFSAIFFCGCCGAFYRNKCLLITYAIITIWLASATVYAAVNLFASVDTVKEAADDILTTSFKNKDNQEVIHYIEAGLSCCGTTGPESYSNSTIPSSCCPSLVSSIQNLNETVTSSGSNIDSIGSVITCSASDAYQKGCVSVFTDYLVNVLQTMGHVFIWIAVVEYVAGFGAIFLSCYYGNK